MKFQTTKQRTVTDVRPFTQEEFINALNEHKPKEIFNSHYSSKVPCWIITEYLSNNRIKYFAHSAADKTPIELSMENLYKSWKTQGLEECYINIDTKENK